MEGERRGGVTGVRSGRALMLPTKRLPPADGRRIVFLIAALVQAGTEPRPDWRRKGGRQIIVSQRHALGTLNSSSPGAGQAAVPRPRDAGAGDRRDPAREAARHISIPSPPLPAAPSETLVALGKQMPGGLEHRRFWKHGLAAGHSRLQGRGIPRRRGRTPTSPGRSPRAAGARPAAPAARRQQVGSRAASPRRARLL